MFGMMEALLSFIRRQVGLRTDADDPDGSLHAKLSHLCSYIPTFMVVASNNLRISADVERSAYGTTPHIVKNIQMGVTGVVRVKFEIKMAAGGTGSFSLLSGGIIVASGSIASNTYVEYNFDCVVSAGLPLQLQTNSDGEYSMIVRNFRVYFDNGTTLVDGNILTN